MSDRDELMELSVDAKVTDAVLFFAKKSKQADSYQNFRNSLEYVGQHGLFYELFVLAHESCDENSTWQHCEHQIGIQMGEWDL